MGSAATAADFVKNSGNEQSSALSVGTAGVAVADQSTQAPAFPGRGSLPAGQRTSRYDVYTASSASSGWSTFCITSRHENSGSRRATWRRGALTQVNSGIIRRQSPRYKNALTWSSSSPEGAALFVSGSDVRSTILTSAVRAPRCFRPVDQFSRGGGNVNLCRCYARW